MQPVTITIPIVRRQKQRAWSSDRENHILQDPKFYSTLIGGVESRQTERVREADSNYEPKVYR